MEHIGSINYQGVIPMPKTKILLFLAICILLFHEFREGSVAASNESHETAAQSNYSYVHIGTLLDLSSPLDTMIHVCLSIALSDFYAAHPNYKTRLFLHTKNAEEELDVALTVIEMLKNGEVHGVLGPQWSNEARFVVELGARAHVPVISFTAKNRAFSYSQSPYFIRTTPDDIYQVKIFSAICQGFQWHEVVVLYEDTEYGNLFVSKLNKAFQEVDIRLAYMSAVSTSIKDSDITKELEKLNTMQTRVFVVHMNILLGHRLFVLARSAGMMSKEYAWLITDSLSNFLTSVDSSLMEGVLGIRPHVPKSKNLNNFRAKWNRNALLMKPESSVMEFNVYGLWAYDTIWGLAMAIEKVMHLKSDILKSSPGENRSKISNVRISQFGERILTELLHTKFTGLSGEFKLVDGQLQPSAFEIFNVIGTGDRTVGYWSPGRGISRKISSEGEPTYSTSTKELRAIMWPGDTLVPPKGWAIPTTGKFKVGIPKKDGFTEFVNIQQDPLTNQFNATGFSIDIFLASLNLLPFHLYYEFVPYINASRNGTWSYNDMLHKIVDKTYDFVVGDVTILYNRSTFVDFTLPYTESGVVMILKNHRIDMWIFLKPLRWDLWMTIGLACIFVGVVLRILEHQSNIIDTGSSTPSQEQQILFFFWLPIAVLAFPERNMVANKSSMFVLVIWLFVAYIMMQSYTAKLSSIFTVDQLNSQFSREYNVGYQNGSFVRDFLINELRLNVTKLKSYRKMEEYHDAMCRGSKNGGIDAIYGETPYMKLLLNRYGSKYRIVGQMHRTDGFGFAFPMGSPLVSYFSRAILNVTQSPIMAVMEQKYFGPGYSSALVSINQDNPSLTAYNFGGLFIIVLSATMIALFCSKTSVGRNFTAMASNYGHRCSIFLTFRGNIAKVHSLSHRDVPGGSSPSSEEANEFEENNTNALQGPGDVRESEGNDADDSGRQREGHESNRESSDVASSGPCEVQLSEISNVNESGGSEGINQPDPNSGADVSSRQIQ